MTKLKTLLAIGIIFLAGCAQKIVPSETAAQSATSQTTNNTANSPAAGNGGAMMKPVNSVDNANSPAELTK